MTTTDLLGEVMARNFKMLQGHLADFTDADMLVRPVPGANHAAWQIGHVMGAEFRMVNLVAPGVLPPLPDGYPQKFGKETTKVDDPSAFPTKTELLEAYEKQRMAVIAWVKTLAPAELDKPVPPPADKMAPTVGHLLELIPGHMAMHIGQIQVIRRKLGKPILF